MHKQNPWTNHEVEEMCRLLRSGKTMTVVARRLKRSRNSITGQWRQVVHSMVFNWNAVRDLVRLPL